MMKKKKRLSTYDGTGHCAKLCEAIVKRFTETRNLWTVGGN